MPQDQYDLNSFRREMQKTPAQPLIDRIADEEGLSPRARRTLRGMAKQEGGRMGTRTSGAQAAGPLQVIPETGLRYVSPAEWETLEGKVRAGVRYTKHLDEMFGGDPYYVSAGYHAGESRVLPYFKAKQKLPRTAEFWDKHAGLYTDDHAQRVLANLGQGDDDPHSLATFRATAAKKISDLNLTYAVAPTTPARREAQRGPRVQPAAPAQQLADRFNYQKPVFTFTVPTPNAPAPTAPVKPNKGKRGPLKFNWLDAANQQLAGFTARNLAAPPAEELAAQHWDAVAARNQQAQELKRKEAEQASAQMSAPERFLKGTGTGIAQAGVGLADLPRTMLKSRTTPLG